jgi:hypothetical protein
MRRARCRDGDERVVVARHDINPASVAHAKHRFGIAAVLPTAGGRALQGHDHLRWS